RASGPVRSFVIDLFRIKDLLGDDLESVALDLAEETAFVPLVAGGAADLMDLQEDGVGVAVEVDRPDVLGVAALLALAPELTAAAAEVTRPAGANGLLVGLAVHPGQHQHLARVGVLRDGRHQPAGLVERDGHARSLVCSASGERETASREGQKRALDQDRYQ